MGEKTAYTRFRIEGRSGAETFAKLYSRELCAPRPKAVQKEIKPEQPQRKTVSARRYVDSLGKKISGLYEKIPQPVINFGRKIADAAKKVGGKIAEWVQMLHHWRHYYRFRRIATALLACVLCFVSIVLTAGFGALSRQGILDELSIYNDRLRSYSPVGGMPKATETEGSDRIIVVSLSDMTAAKRSEKPLETAFYAGLNEFSSLGLDIELYHKIEAGAAAPKASAFGRNGNRDIAYVTEPTREQLDTVGCHTLRIRTKGKERNVLLIVEDTTVPSVVLRDVEITVGDSADASMFIEKTNDPSPLMVAFSHGEPDITILGEQLVYLSIMDIYGNACELLAARLNIISNIDYSSVSDTDMQQTAPLSETDIEE